MFSLFSPKGVDWLWGPPSLPFNGYRGYIPGVKRPELRVGNSHLSSEEVNNEWSCTFAPPMSSRSEQEKFYLYISVWLKITSAMRRRVAGKVVSDFSKQLGSSSFILDPSKMKGSCSMCKSDVRLTVHRNSVWIRKTN